MDTRTVTDDFVSEECLCQGTVPADKRIDFQQRLYNEKTQQWKWKTVLRYHKDCSIHGVTVDATRTEPSEM